jgi:rubrerythrin
MTKAECKRLRHYLADEKQGNKTYLRAAKRERCPRAKRAYRVMAKDERKHRAIVNRILKARCIKRRRYR